MTESLTAVFNEIRKTYFPNWKAGNEWRVCCNHPKTRGAIILQGMCLPEEKVIVVRLPSKKYERAVLAHEICHAVTNSKYHDKRWRDRFTMVGNQAEMLGNKEFSDYILEEVESYKYELPMRHGIPIETYRILESIVYRYPSASFEQVVEWMINEFGYSRARLAKCRNLQKYFNLFKIGQRGRMGESL